MPKATDYPKGNVFFIPPEDVVIVTDENHYLYDERARLRPTEEMILNVMAHGVKEPVLVSSEDGKLLVVAGRQRVMAACEANKRFAADGRELMRVPCMVEKGTDADKYGVLILENEIRRDETVMTKAQKAYKLNARHGRTVDEIAVTFGTTAQTIRNWLALFDLAAPVQQAVDQGRLPMTAALKLRSLDKVDQVYALHVLMDEQESQPASAGKREKRITTPKVAAKLNGSAPDAKTAMVTPKHRAELVVECPNAPFAAIALCEWVLGHRLTAELATTKGFDWISRIDMPEGE